MEYLLAAIVGWCGTYWPRRFVPRGPVPGGGFDPDNPWPPNCPVCGPFVGAIAGIVAFVVLSPRFGTGMAEIAVLSFFGGAFGSSLIGGLIGLGSRGKAVNG